jgi:hypothetical protein
MLSGTLMIVALAIIILRSSVLPTAQTSISANVGTIERLNCLPTYLTNPSSVAGWWKLDEGQGTEARDSSGRGNHGTLSTTPPVWTNGILSGGLNFPSGNIRNVAIPNSDGLLTGGSSFTLEAWVKRVDIGSTCQIIVKQQAYSLNFQSTNVLYSSVNPGISISSNTVFTDTGNWHHVAMVFISMASITLYVDGNMDKTQSVTGAFSQGASNPLYISGGTISNMLRGKADNVVIYNRALTPQEIRNDYECGGNAYV